MHSFLLKKNVINNFGKLYIWHVATVALSHPLTWQILPVHFFTSIRYASMVILSSLPAILLLCFCCCWCSPSALFVAIDLRLPEKRTELLSFYVCVCERERKKKNSSILSFLSFSACMVMPRSRAWGCCFSFPFLQRRRSVSLLESGSLELQQAAYKRPFLLPDTAFLRLGPTSASSTPAQNNTSQTHTHTHTTTTTKNKETYQRKRRLRFTNITVSSIK